MAAKYNVTPIYIFNVGYKKTHFIIKEAFRDNVLTINYKLKYLHK